MADPRWMGPPEVVAATFEAGPGPASVLASQLVWVTEAISHELMAGLSAVNSAATAAEWVGGGGTASAQNAFGLNAGLQTLVGWITHKVAVTQAAADAHLLAASTVIPSAVSQTNRAETAVLHSTNWFGQNTGAIAERELEYYGVHWPHNSAIGWAYSSALTGLAASLGVPPPVAPPGASPAAPAVAGTAAAQSAARAATGGLASTADQAAAPAHTPAQAGSFLQQAPQLASTLAEPAKSVAAAPTSALQSFSGAPQAMMGMFSAADRFAPAGALGADPAVTAAAAEPVRAGGVAAGAGGYPGAALTSYTRPAGTFSPPAGGRPVGRAGVLNAAELRGPTGTAPGGTPVPMAPAAGMLGRTAAGGDRDETSRARIVVVSAARETRSQ